MSKIRSVTREFFRREDGAALVEYAVLLVLVAIACIVAAAFLGRSISRMFDSTGKSIENM
jgi:Flp pilus assembly pilin Flp